MKLNDQVYVDGNFKATGEISTPFIDLLYGVIEVLIEKDVIKAGEILQKQLEYQDREEDKHEHLVKVLYASLSKSEFILLGLEKEGRNEQAIGKSAFSNVPKSF